MWDMIGLVAKLGIYLFNWNKESREKGLIRMQNYVNSKKDFKYASKKMQMQQREQKKAFANYGEPERPADSRIRQAYTIPKIVYVDVDVKTHGKYRTPNGKAKGLLVHFTAGRSLKGAQDAINTLIYLASKGLGCMVMDIDGIIYMSKNQKMDDVAYHAGKSSYNGLTGMSRYLHGMEICCAGKINPDGSTDWGEVYPKENTRVVSDKDNVKAGVYHEFTSKQEYWLLNFILWQLDVNPEYKIEFILGHDEVAPNRKKDPGGSLSMTMPEFREYIRKKIIDY